MATCGRVQARVSELSTSWTSWDLREEAAEVRGGPRTAAGCVPPSPSRGTPLPVEAVGADAEAGVAAPGAVGIPGEDAVRARLVAAAVGQGQLGHLETGAGEEQLLRGQGERAR